VLTQANVEIARDNPEAQFVTMFAAVLDAETGALEYWNAGHDAPVLKSAALGSLESAVGGPPLCVLDEFDYGSDSAQLARGDAVVLFTDGVTEAANGAGEFYGRQRLNALLARVGPDAAAGDILREILADLRGFVGSAEPSDDITLLVVRWLGPDGNAVAAGAAARPQGDVSGR
jgi:serine phosphatase RsbU (regulator of sigma subunit)